MWSTYTYISTLQDAVLGDPGWPESGSNSPDSSLSCAICLGKSLSHSDTSLAYLWNDDNRTHPIRLLCGLDTIIYVKHLHSAWHIVNTLCESPWLKHTQLINCEITLWATLHQEIALQGFKMQGFTYQNGTYLQNIFGKTSKVLLRGMQGSVSSCLFQGKSQGWIAYCSFNVSHSTGQRTVGTTKPHLLTVQTWKWGLDRLSYLSSHNDVITPCMSLSTNKVEHLY